jgi:hypothetical protein
MLVFTRAMKMAAAAVSLAVMLLGAATPSQAQTTGQVRLHIVKVGFIIGVGGGQVATLQNGNGVVLRLQGVQAGFQVSIGLGGMTLSLR